MSITLRRATPQDKPRIVEISSQMWDGEDYVPDVIDEWLTDQDAELTVALLDDQVVAFARCLWLLPGYAWFEGIRTDPARQNRGVGKALTRHFLDQAARAGARHVGLWSDIENEASIHIVETHGFTRVAVFVYVEADAESPARREARPAPQAEAVSSAEAQAFVQHSAFLALSRGRLPCNWRFYPFDLGAEKVLTGMAHRIGIRDGDRLTALLCANEPVREGESFTVDYLDGDPAGVEALLRHALHLARQASVVEVMVPQRGEQAGCALDVARRLGFKSWHEFAPDMFVYERAMEPACEGIRMNSTAPSPLSSRPYVAPDDLESIVETLIAYRLATSVRRYSPAWRVRLLLSSRVWDRARDARVWEDAAGRLVGWAMLWRRQPQAPYLILDRFVHPALVTADLVDASLAWGDERAREIAAEQGNSLTLYVGGLDPAVCPDDRPEAYGFALMAPDPQNYSVYLARSLQATLPDPALPEGYAIRPLGGLDELEAYQDLYDFAAVDPQHRRELLASDEYELLVVTDPAGVLVAYAECSICRVEWARSGQRIGWVDYVGTRPEQQGQGLGRAVLLACLHRLQAWDAETAMLVTISTNAPALRVYQATGFDRVQVPDLPVYEKQIPVPTA